MVNRRRNIDAAHRAHEKLRGKYGPAWRKLTDWYVKGEAQALDAEQYERELCSRVAPMLGALADVLGLRDQPLGLGRSIIYVNSAVCSARVRLPMWGGKDYKSAEWEAWRNLVYESDGRRLVFLDPGQARHILTESMWRLRKSRRWGSGACVAIFAEGDELWRACRASSEVFAVPLFPEGGANRWPPKSKSKTPRLLTIARALGHDDEKGLLRHLRRILNARLDELSAEVEVDIGPYSETKVRELFERPLLLLHRGSLLPGSHAKNIFYLTDVVETEEVAALDGEMVVQAGARVSSLKVRTFAKEVQWLCSTYVSRLVTSAERTLSRAGDAYPSAYFYHKSNADHSQSGLESMLKVIGTCFSKVGARSTTARTLDCIRRHFAHAESPRGVYWRGYPKQSFEVACCVAELMGVLFGKGHLADTVRSCGAELVGLDRAIAAEPLFIRQLFRALGAERELFLVPRYREHFIHSFHVFVLGLIILTWRPLKVLPPRLEDLNPSKRTLQEWFVVAMWHDIAYLFEKMGSIGESLVRRLIGESNVKRVSGFLPINPKFGHLVQQVERWLDVMVDVRKTWDKIISMPSSIETVSPHDLLTAVALDRTDHGVWSALMLAHALSVDPGRDKCLAGLRTSRDRLVSAIIPHHIALWDVKRLIASFGNWDEETGRYDIADVDRETIKEIKISAQENSLGYLLGLCDMLGQAGREAEDVAGVAPSHLGVRLAYLGVDRDRHALRIELRYEGDRRKATEIGKRHFKCPARYLGLNGNGSPARGGLVVAINSKYSAPCEIWLELET